MSIQLKGCDRCGGDIIEERMPGYPAETVCLQCGMRGTPPPHVLRTTPRSQKRPGNGS